MTNTLLFFIFFVLCVCLGVLLSIGDELQAIRALFEVAVK